MALVSVVIPTWNRADLVAAVLGDLSRQGFASLETIVVDNGSTDQSAAVAQAAGARVLALPENRGFAEAVNLGIQAARGEWILLLNNDVTLEPHYIERLVAAAVTSQAKFATGKIVMAEAPETLEGTFDLVSQGGYAWRCGFGRPDSALWSEPCAISWAPMTAALFSRSLFDFLGGLDVYYRSYYEDVDFGLRCAKAGMRGVYVPSAVARHIGSATLGKRSARVYFWSSRNQLLLLARHYDLPTACRAAWPILVGQSLALVAGARHRHFWASLCGKVAALGPGLPALLKKKADARAAYQILKESEAEIQRLQSALGFDLYWRWYFRLVRSK
jgi:GT2 family glycosyltransferase